MRAFKLSKHSKLTIEDKKKLLSEYDIEDLLYTLREYENSPKDYEKEIVIELHNKLFENGITCV